MYTVHLSFQRLCIFYDSVSPKRLPFSLPTHVFKQVLLVGIAEPGPWQARRAVHVCHLPGLRRVRRRSPQRAGSAHIPKRVVQKGMKRARSPAGGAGEDAGPCRARELAQGCRVATATGALFVHSGSSCLPPARLSRGRAGPAAPSAAGLLRPPRRLRGRLGHGGLDRKDTFVLGEIKCYWKKKDAIWNSSTLSVIGLSVYLSFVSVICLVLGVPEGLG